jgi:hypothetical protein
MARTITPAAKIAKVANTDLEMHFDFRDPVDPEAVVLDDMKSILKINWEDGSTGTAVPVTVSDVLDNVATVTTGTELSNFRATLAKLRDAGFDASGIPDV